MKIEHFFFRNNEKGVEGENKVEHEENEGESKTIIKKN